MNGEEHYKEAELLLSNVPRNVSIATLNALLEAQVHATLALASAVEKLESERS